MFIQEDRSVFICRMIWSISILAWLFLPFSLILTKSISNQSFFSFDLIWFDSRRGFITYSSQFSVWYSHIMAFVRYLHSFISRIISILSARLTQMVAFLSFESPHLSKQTIHAFSIVTGSRWYLFSITYNRASHKYFIPSFTLILKFRSRIPLYWHSALLSSASLHSGPLSPLDLNTTPFTPIALANRW